MEGGSTVGAPRLIGRAQELARLEQLLVRACEGRGSVAFIGGPAGMGKSHLAQAVADQARDLGFWVFSGHCQEAEGRVPYAPLVDILESALRTFPDPARFVQLAGPSAAAVAKLLPRLQPYVSPTEAAPHLPPEQERELTVHLLAELVEPTAQLSPVCVVIEDLQWADDATLRLVHRLAERIVRLPVLILGTFRDNELATDHPLGRLLDELRRQRLAETLTLRPFQPAETEELLLTLAEGQPLDPATAATLHAHTDGNPFFAAEVYRHLRDTRALDGGRLRDAQAIDIPMSVKLAVGRRLDRLAFDTLTVLSAAAVAGRGWTAGLLAAVTGFELVRVIAALDEAEAAAVLAPDRSAPEPVPAFAHELVRQTVLSRLSISARQRLHLAVAEALERLYPGLAELTPHLAHHYFSAGDLAPARKRVWFLLEAGRHALSVAAYPEAMRHFERGLLLGAGAGETGSLYFGLGLAQGAAGHWDAAVHSWERALVDGGDSLQATDAGRIAATAAQQLAWEGRWLDSLALANRGLRVVTDADPALRARLLAMAGVVQSLAGNAPAAAALVAEAHELAAGLVDDSLHGFLGFADCVRHFCYLEHREAVAAGLRAAELLRRANELWELAGLYPFVHWSLVLLGRFDEAERLAALADPLCRHLDHAIALGLVDRGRSQVEFLPRGSIEPALAASKEVLGRLQQRHSSFLLADQLEWVGVLEFWRGDWDAALERFQAAAAVEPPGTLGGDWSLIPLIRAYRGERAEALRLLESRWQQVPVNVERPSRAEYRVLWAAAETLHVCGDAARAGSLYPAVRRSLESGQLFTFYTQRSLALVAALTAFDAGELDAARAHFEEALRIADELPIAVERAEVRRFYADALTTAWPQEAPLAAALREEAAAIYSQLGMARHQALVAAPAAPTSISAEPVRPRAVRLRREADLWVLERDGRQVHLSRGPGFDLLAELLRRPGDQVHVLDLLSVLDARPRPTSAAQVRALDLHEPSYAGVAPDPQAVAAYRGRLVELAGEIRQAEADHDTARTAEMKAEFDFIAGVVQNALGLGGRERPVGSNQERARTRVTKAISRALEKIEQVDAPLGEHLRRCVSTGTYCSYSPDPLTPVDWLA